MKIESVMPVDVVLEELGRRLAVARKAQGQSQQVLAETAGIGVATLRRIEGGSDGQLGSWVKVLAALGMAAAIDGLLPEELRSPMAEVKSSRQQKYAARGGISEGVSPWGDEAP